MTHKLVVALTCLGLVATAGAEVNFDTGIDVKNVIEQAEKSDVKGLYPQYGYDSVRHSRDCRSFSFGPSDSPVSSQRVYLESTEYVETCHFVPAPKPPNPPVTSPRPPRPSSGAQGIKEGSDTKNSLYQGEYSHAGYQNGRVGTWVCRERVGQVFRATAQMSIAPRRLYPWERESFNVCMDGPRVDFDTTASPYSYSVDREGMFDLTFKLTPGHRVPSRPDADGLYSAAFSHKDGKFTLSVDDRWAREYAGEKVAIKVELIKDGFLFFNSNKGEKEFTFDSAGSYDLVFAEGDLTKSKDFVDDSMDKGRDAKYYVKWGFRRLGQVSTNAYINKGKTDKIKVD
ncbi:MAG: hypothetical protein A2234_08540 [Elusimicrobia bacterium RIFOXYA2_FULL_58_8]|nr:MAG: hypothetical protein A2234_08540 [Elusimicrobia bacterium RIFOXYA2_FULL_58_8]